MRAIRGEQHAPRAQRLFEELMTTLGIASVTGAVTADDRVRHVVNSLPVRLGLLKGIRWMIIER